GPAAAAGPDAPPGPVIAWSTPGPPPPPAGVALGRPGPAAPAAGIQLTAFRGDTREQPFARTQTGESQPMTPGPGPTFPTEPPSPPPTPLPMPRAAGPTPSTP